MPVRLHRIVVDGYDAQGLARFWTQAPGWEVLSECEDEIAIGPDQNAPRLTYTAKRACVVPLAVALRQLSGGTGTMAGSGLIIRRAGLSAPQGPGPAAGDSRKARHAPSAAAPPDPGPAQPGS